VQPFSRDLGVRFIATKNWKKTWQMARKAIIRRYPQTDITTGKSHDFLQERMN
jgi:hypothetical protein